MKRLSLLCLTCVVGLVCAAPSFAASGVVTIYSADGLRDGHPNWYDTEFKAFTDATGIKVQYIEAGSGVIVNRVARERTNPQADVLVTLPPFIQEAADDGLLAPYKSSEAHAIPADTRDAQYRWYPMVNNYFSFIYNDKVLSKAPATFADLLNPKFKNRIQYSTPGQAGDGTSVMLLSFHVFGGKDAGFDYLKKLQSNNLGPSASTGKLTAKVNKGEIWVSNGDVQMNFAQMADNPNIRIFWPADHNGVRWSFAIPYAVGLVKGAPHADNGKKLIDFLLGKKAQTDVSTVARGFPVRSDLKPTDANYKQLEEFMTGVKIWSPKWSTVSKDLKSDVARWHEVTGS